MTTGQALRLLWSVEADEDLKPGELATAVGVDVSTIYRWKRGTRPVGLSLTALLEYLEGRGLITRKIRAGDGRRPSAFQVGA